MRNASDWLRDTRTRYAYAKNLRHGTPPLGCRPMTRIAVRAYSRIEALTNHWRSAVLLRLYAAVYERFIYSVRGKDWSVQSFVI